jgi:hypothetical protein
MSDPLKASDEIVIPNEEETKVDASIKNLIKDRKMLINLLCLLFLWVASAFDYYLINF